jgi:uncharacterized membrane protein
MREFKIFAFGVGSAVGLTVLLMILSEVLFNHKLDSTATFVISFILGIYASGYFRRVIR